MSMIFTTRLRLTAVLTVLSFACALLLTSCEGGNEVGNAREISDAKTKTESQQLITPEESTFFSTVQIEPGISFPTASDGDLWPVAWADDDALYTANGDGLGFDLLGEWSDIVVNKMTGTPSEANLEGERLAAGDQVGKVWSDAQRFNRKPTGMIAVDGDLYLAVQDLNKDDAGGDIFNEAPAATIYKSTDKGKTWTTGADAPMFKDHTFTTIMFLDYGKEGANNTFDDYVYAYGMDYNWRDSFNDVVTDPAKLYLARMPKDKIQDAGSWAYYSGSLKGKAAWTKPGDIAGRKPVLQDERRVYPEADRLTPGLGNMSVISQGSIVYNRPLNRYIYTSWTEFTFEFYEAPKPWGPWKRFLSTDFGDYPWTSGKNGGYATVIPSKFISEDGQEMWLNSNTFVGGVKNYNFALRKLKVTPYKKSKPDNDKNDHNLALPEYGKDATPISRAMNYGRLNLMNDGDREGNSEDSWNGLRKLEDWWGYTWSHAYNFNKVVYSAGGTDSERGGWFDNVRVQTRQDFEWKDVDHLRVTPEYPADESAGTKTYTFTFDDTQGDGIRIIGKPGGAESYTSVTELEIYYSDSSQ